MGASVTDAQCGFKAARAEVARPLVEKVSDDGFFFDTELLLLAEYNGLRVHEVPVDWVEEVDSRVNVRRTASADLRGVARVAHEIAVGRLALTCRYDQVWSLFTPTPRWRPGNLALNLSRRSSRSP